MNNFIKNIANQYNLSNLSPLDNHILSGFQNNFPIILKLSADIDGLKQEVVALNAFAGFGTVEVLAEKEGQILLTRAVPGTSLKTYFPSQDNEAIQITCEIIKRLHQAPLPPENTFPHIRDWLKILDQEWDIPIQDLKKSRELRDQLLATSAEPVLLHGDLHHDNILQNGKDWVVIDPKGVIGEQAYEVAAFIRNPIPELLDSENAANIIKNRITAFSKILGFDAKRIQDWCFVQAVLAWAWALEDGIGSSYFKYFTEIIQLIKSK